MERIHIIIAIVLVLSALKKFEDILAQYRENVEASRFNIKDCSCILGTAGRQAPLSPSEQRPGSALRSRLMAGGGCNKTAMLSLLRSKRCNTGMKGS